MTFVLLGFYLKDFTAKYPQNKKIFYFYSVKAKAASLYFITILIRLQLIY